MQKQEEGLPLGKPYSLTLSQQVTADTQVQIPATLRRSANITLYLYATTTRRPNNVIHLVPLRRYIAKQARAYNKQYQEDRERRGKLGLVAYSVEVTSIAVDLRYNIVEFSVGGTTQVRLYPPINITVDDIVEARVLRYIVARADVIYVQGV